MVDTIVMCTIVFRAVALQRLFLLPAGNVHQTTMQTTPNSSNMRASQLAFANHTDKMTSMAILQ
jgi:hypothetical protein